jgi:hypothetical protein
VKHALDFVGAEFTRTVENIQQFPTMPKKSNRRWTSKSHSMLHVKDVLAAVIERTGYLV